MRWQKLCGRFTVKTTNYTETEALAFGSACNR